SYLLSDTVSELGTVDEKNAIRFFRNYALRGLSNAPHQPRQILQNCAQPHKGDLVRIEERLHAPRRKVIATDTDYIDKPICLAPQRIDQIGTKKITGFFTGHDCYFQRPALGAHFLASFLTRLIVSMKRPLSFAAAMVSPKPRMNVLPASTAIPDNPAFAEFSTVEIPIVGRSALSSCCGFAILTRTPPRRGMRPAARNSRTRSII